MTVRELIILLGQVQNLDHHITVKVPWYPHDRFHIRAFHGYDSENSGNEYFELGSVDDVLTETDVKAVPA